MTIVSELRVLLVEDDALLAGVHRRLLRRYGGYDVSWVETLEDARAALAAGDFDAVLCDLSLPDGSGAELIAWARGARPEILRRFIAITGGAIDPASRALVDAGQLEVLRKPIDPDDLLERVAAISHR